MYDFDLRKIQVTQDLPEQNDCVSQGASVQTSPYCNYFSSICGLYWPYVYFRLQNLKLLVQKKKKKEKKIILLHKIIK
jgi:hypothetical protein